MKFLLEGYEVSAELDRRQKIDDDRNTEAEGAPCLDDVFLEQDQVDLGAGRPGQEQVEENHGAGEPSGEGDQEPCHNEEGHADPGQAQPEQSVLVCLGAAAEVAEPGGREDREGEPGREEHENEDTVFVTHGTLPETLRAHMLQPIQI